jgi:ABC-type lipoprotein release transport system permease subunit
VASRIAELMPGARVLDRELMRRSYELTFDTRGGLLSALLLPALAAFLLLAWDRLSGLSAAERREVGVLKSIGWSTTDVLAARLWESTSIAALGAVLGLGIAYVYVFVFDAPGLVDALLGWSALYPTLELAPTLDLVQLLTIVGAIVVPFAALSVVPAWRAAIIDPDRALRGDS